MEPTPAELQRAREIELEWYADPRPGSSSIELVCELCSCAGGVVRLSSGLLVHPACFFSGRLSSQFLNRRFARNTGTRR